MEASTKSILRTRVRELVRALSAEERVSLSQKLCAVMRAQWIWSRTASVLCFVPLTDEPDITSLIDDALQANKTVALPRYSLSSKAFVAAHIKARAQCIRGEFGVLEPDAGCPVIPLNQLDLVLVPGVAYDLTGRRLGRGKGFYDRLLAEVRGHKCGVAFDAQIIAAVPEEPHDVRVNSILTPTRWRLCDVES